MLCYKEVHKYNGNYYSRWDNGYQYRLGEIAEPTNDDYIYATDTIEHCLQYGMCPFDIAILEMEIVEGTEYHQNGMVITAKAVKIIREVTQDERDNKSGREIPQRKCNPVLYDLLQQKRQSILSAMR